MVAVCILVYRQLFKNTSTMKAEWYVVYHIELGIYVITKQYSVECIMGPLTRDEAANAAYNLNK